MSKLAYSYIRFSSKLQESGDSKRRQEQLALEWCEAHGYTLSNTRFEDLGVSGFTGANMADGSALNQFMELCKKGLIEKGATLVIESFDRLSRAKSTEATRIMLEILRYVRIVTLDDGRSYDDNATATDLIPAQIQIERAHSESKIKSERGKANWKRKRELAAKGEDNKSNSCPFWLKVNEEDRTQFELIPNYVEVVIEVFNLREQGLGNVRIAKKLNDQGIPFPSINQNRKVKPTGWSYVTISKLLRNRAVLGEYRPNTVKNKVHTPTGEVFDNYYPPIISDAQFNRVQVMIDKNAKSVKTGGSTRTNRNVLLHTGRCAKCGSKLITEIKRGCVYVRCKHSKVSNECDSGSLRLDLFYELLKTYFSNHISLNSWVTEEDTTDLDSKKVEVSNKIKMKKEELKKALLVAGFDEKTIETMLSNHPEVIELQKESDRINEIFVRAEVNNANRVESLDHLINLLGLASSETHEPENIQARLRVKSIIDSFNSIRIYYSDYTAHVEISDLEFSKVYFKSIRGASSVKGNPQLWHLQEYKTLEV